MPPKTFGEVLEDIMGSMNLIEELIGIACALWYDDAGYQFKIRRIDKGGKHSMPEIKAILEKYGVAVYWYRFSGHYISFRIKTRQARWGEYVLLRAGVQLLNPSFDHRNAGWASRHTDMPKAWGDAK